MSEITKGPWKFNPDRGDIISTTVTKEESYVARGQYGDDSWNYYGGEVIAETVMSCNGPVLAAAPELLEALKAMVPAYDDARAQNAGHELLAQARAAIEKAEGR